jgi:diaminopimelate epimerase
MVIAFSKYEALGNDFIIIDESQEKKHSNTPATSLSFRKLLCNRKGGIGGDGVITLLPAQDKSSVVFMHLTNADGSIPENCGNGLRCVAAWLLEHGRVSRAQAFSIDTLSGPKRALITDEGVKVELGVAQVSLNFKDDELRTLQNVEVVAYVEIGNPHLILKTNDPETMRLELGPRLEKLPVFPHGVNVSFVRLEDAHSITLRVWERGAGATDACGTGAGASVASFLATGKLREGIPVRVHFKNGELSVAAKRRSEQEFDVEIVGGAQKVFEGIGGFEV